MCANYFSAYAFAVKPNKHGLVQNEMDINQREAHAVVMMIHSRLHLLTGRTLHLFVDNRSVEFSIVKCWAKALDLID